jgi:hypothetical protein
MAMRDSIRKIFVLGVFFSAVAGVWTLGAVKANLDGPSDAKLRVDPAIVRAALLADPSVDPGSVEGTAISEGPAVTYLLAS